MKLNTEKMNKKIFSLSDLIEMGLITPKQLEDAFRYQEAKRIVNQMFNL